MIHKGFKKLTAHTIHEEDLSDMMLSCFPNIKEPYSYVANEEVGNHTSTHNVDASSGFLELEGLNSLNRGEVPMYITGNILDYLSAQGIVPEGKVIIDHSW